MRVIGDARVARFNLWACSWATAFRASVLQTLAFGAVSRTTDSIAIDRWAALPSNHRFTERQLKPAVLLLASVLTEQVPLPALVDPSSDTKPSIRPAWWGVDTH